MPIRCGYMKNSKLMLQIFLLLFIASAFVLFVSGCLSSNEPESYDSIEMKSFVSESEMEEYFQTFYTPMNDSLNNWRYSSYSGNFWRTESGEIIITPGPVADYPVVPKADIAYQISSSGNSIKTNGQTIYYTPNSYYPYHFVENEDSRSMDNSTKYYTYDAEKRTFVIDALPPADASVLSQLNMSGDLYLVNDTLVTIHYNLITGYNISDPAAPREIWKKQLWGDCIDSRVVDGKFYLFVQNQTILSLTEYMGTGVHYKDIYYPTSPDLRHLSTQNIYYISEVDVQSGNFDKTVALLGTYSSIVCESDQSFYLTSNYTRTDSLTIISRINLKTFDIKTGSVSSPTVTPNSVSLNEYGGYLRVATMGSSNWIQWDQVHGSVYVFDENMDVVGSLTGFKSGEPIHRFQFAGDKLYFVSFNQVDPFFAIDLSNPKKPKVLGELKLPDSPTYLYPINETTVISLGKTDNDSMKLALFDVTNFKNPIERDSYIFDLQSSSASGYHSFMWDAEKNLLVIPAYEHTYVFKVSSSQISLVLDDVYEKDRVVQTIYINDYFYTFSKREVHILNQNTWECVKVVDIPQPEFKF